jgi:hypothetical protein
VIVLIVLLAVNVTRPRLMIKNAGPTFRDAV